MAGHPLSGLIIRTGAVRLPDVGYILACDPERESQEIQHTISFTWKSGKFNRGEANFSAVSCCITQHPEPGLVKVGGSGSYSFETGRGITAGNIFKNGQPQQSRTGDIRSTSEIAGSAYAVGLRGLVCRLDQSRMWTYVDHGLPRTFNIQAVHGFNGSDIYAVGRRGDVWRFDGHDWMKLEVSTNGLLTTVKCAGDGLVYIGGHSGILIRGRETAWNVIDQEETTDDLWDLEWFEGTLYVSTMSGVYRLRGETLEAVDFGADSPKTTYQLSAAKGVLWSIGRSDVMSFDGERWTRVV